MSTFFLISTMAWLHTCASKRAPWDRHTCLCSRSSVHTGKWDAGDMGMGVSCKVELVIAKHCVVC